MHRPKRLLDRVYRGLQYCAVLLVALLVPDRRSLLREVLALGRQLPVRLDQPLPAALQALTPYPARTTVDPETIRRIVDAAAAFGVGRPLGICLRRSLLRFYFLRRAHVPLVVHFGARRLGDSLGGHAWLTCQGRPYHEAPEHYQSYAVMFSFPSQEPP